MSSTRFALGLAMAAAVSVLPTATLRSDQAPPVSVPGIDKPVVVVTGSIRGTESWVSANYYVLRGAVFVEDGATLNIAAGTRIVGESGSVGTLVVLQGGRLNAIGTAQQPNDGFFETMTFIGAVPPAPEANWMDGWTSFPQN
ncbi:MAG: hypothetical protein A3F70_01260 [Acidobacteria bacterium RIFCSPLOWO2_12_FULL_67_14]|nr:MAG: hypothetical protein A3F70_01260 [Acidobacteria bacterium RIFCSPLOWO2_12_FULL_67_14]